MSNFEELERKLNNTQRDLEKIKEDFSKFLELKNSLQSSDTSLKSSSDNMGRLASSLEESAQGLRACVSYLQNTVAILNKIEPERIMEGQSVAEKRLGDIVQKIDRISEASERAQKNLLRDAKEEDEGDHTLIKRSAAREWILLILAIVILGATLFSFYLDHGLPNWAQVTNASNDVSIDETSAEIALADQFLNGPVTAQDYAEAARLYRLAAERGDAGAQNNLGALYLIGRGVRQDTREAATWFRRAAEQGLAEAQHNLGSMHITGDGAEEDLNEAVRWWRLAAAQGYAEAQYNLGVAYFDGLGVPQDYGLAAEWYRLSAEQGHADAQLNLGRMLLNGDGIERNNVEAYKWLMLSADRFGQGKEELRSAALEERDVAASQMSPEEIESAEMLARDWTSK